MDFSTTEENVFPSLLFEADDKSYGNWKSFIKRKKDLFLDCRLF
jgi:hypothetical protein